MPNAKVLSEKQAVVAALTEQLQGAASGVLVDYKGITVAEDTALRVELRQNDVQYGVVKNTLTRFAMKNVGLSELDDVLNGLPRTARLVVHRKIKPAVLARARQLMVDARLATTEEQSKAKLDAAHRLLARFDSYTPDKLIVKNAGPHKLGQGWSPGFAMLQMSRRGTVTSLNSSPALEIRLPEPAREVQ